VNTYLSLRPLPAFDVPWPDRSAFYDRLAGRDVTLIEAPALGTRSRQLHREAFLRHRARTLLGFLPGERPAVLPAGPYVWLGRDDPRRSGADLLVLHLAADDEAARYWDFVYARPAAVRGPWRALMERQRERFAVPRPGPLLVQALRAQLGQPFFEDGTLLVWDLHDSARSR
jgi:hypothetical protein